MRAHILRTVGPTGPTLKICMHHWQMIEVEARPGP